VSPWAVTIWVIELPSRSRADRGRSDHDVPLQFAATIDEAAALVRAAPSPIVAVPVYDSSDDVVRCVEAILTHTRPEISVLIVDDDGPDRRAFEQLDAITCRLGRSIVVLRHERNHGYVRSCNDAFAITAGRDIVLVNSDVVVGAEWLERLTAAALSDDSIATASTLTNHGTILSVPERNEPRSELPDGLDPEEAARRVAAGSIQRRPTIPTAVGHCVYIRRHALDLVGPYDETFEPGYGEEVDFSQRAIMHGLRHVCADDVFTYHRGAGSFSGTAGARARQERHERIVQHRYHWYGPWVARVANEQRSELADALATARRSLLGLTVGVDALCLGPHEMGTQKNVVETVRALARRPEIARLVVFVPPRLPAYAETLPAELPSVAFVPVDLFGWRAQRLVDVVYRPYQISEMVELRFLSGVAERFVVAQLDTIAFENPAYFGSAELWREYRDVTRLTFGLAHGIAFVSEHGRRSAVASGLLVDGRPSAVISSGVSSNGPTACATRPAALGEADDSFVLCVGASYRHKNRRFALDVWAELRRRGWPGRIVLAGPDPPFGNSLDLERQLLVDAPELRSGVVTLGAVTEAEKRWLYRHAALVLYPSSVEGFGLVPFEAAAHGAPTLPTRRGSLAEVLPPGIPALDDFQVSNGADVAWQLLHDPETARGVVAALRARAECFTWDRTVDRLVDLLLDVLRRPPGRMIALEGENGHSIGLPSRAAQRQPSLPSEALERFVHEVIQRPALKRALSPNGSRRQRAARSMISRARRQLG
jgi:glycosyltransferase involved in cell wall biosynthesis